ncbi:dipeptide epimerase [Streptomyces hebeiensis]|uniref:Dipeptide epimerase n=1 Tax=Streptomyces hebeiensis TaxID=229486 RepID=A0ABP4FTJ6_9ACTN
MFDPAFLRSMTGTALRVLYETRPAPGTRDWSVLRVALHNAGHTGRGEATLVTYATEHGPAAALAQVDAVRHRLERMITPVDLLDLLPAGPARNALDSALWDLLAKRSGQRVWQLLGLPRPRPLPTIRTVPLLDPASLSRALRSSATHPAIKLKLGAGGVEDDIARLEAVRRHRPDAWLMADADGAWDVDRLRTMLPVLESHGVRLLEQPLPSWQARALARLRRPFPIICDLSYGDEGDLGRVADQYDGINVKLDVAGGLTATLGVIERARQRGLSALVGSLPATERAMAAVLHVGLSADHVNLPERLWMPDDIALQPNRANGVSEPLPRSVWG